MDVPKSGYTVLVHPTTDTFAECVGFWELLASADLEPLLKTAAWQNQAIKNQVQHKVS